MKHKTIFRALFEERRSTVVKNEALVRSLNWDESFLLEFLAGTQDVENEMFFKRVLATMPVDFQIAYWQQISRELKQVTLASVSNTEGQEKERPEERMNAIAEKVEVSVEELKLLLDEMPVLLEESMNKPFINELVSEVAWRKIEAMMAICLEDKTEELLRERAKEIKPRYLPWETFQDIIQGNRLLLHMREVEELKVYIDYELPDRYSILEWANVFMHFNQDLRSLGDHRDRD
ncbi:MAG: hypothetical protein J7647_26455 [Cyanobacteria bacterium SBLK]|nr:hypothetical protein [Cyanobacteria bacterium SBLK]